jgi:hypothetical protein
VDVAVTTPAADADKVKAALSDPEKLNAALKANGLPAGELNEEPRYSVYY